ncbi:tetratricopeptide repeat protein [Candidatus Babeliales bacterium]|nr:tetratricopeptide repeat protein [Candidatus Babeliales bacterium]
MMVFVLTILLCNAMYCNATLLGKENDSLLSFVSTSTEANIKHSSLYLKANYLQRGGKYNQALKTYNDLFTLKAPPYIYEGYLRLLSETNQSSAIVNLIDKTEEIFKDDLPIQLIYAQSLLNTNNDQQAEKLLDRLKEKHPENEQVAYFSAAQHEKTNKLQKALETIDSFLAKNRRRSKIFLFHFLKAKILLKMGNHTQSLATIDKSLEFFPKFDKAILFKALVLEQMNKIDQAINTYKSFLKLVGPDPVIQKQLVQLLFSQKRYDQAALELRKLKSNTPDYYFDIALLEFNAKNYPEALECLNKSLAQNKNFVKAKVLKIEVLIAMKKFGAVLAILEEWLIERPHDNAIINTLLTLQKSGIQSESVLALLKRVNQKYKNHHNIVLAMADLFLQTKQYTEALKCYKQTLRQTKNKELQAKIRFQLGLILFMTNKKSAAISQLQDATNQKIVFHAAYNLLAYCYAEQNKNLKTALSLIEKALDYDIESPYYLDTKGFIFYQQQKYALAVNAFQQAHNFAPNDPTIRKHLSEAEAKVSK